MSALPDAAVPRPPRQRRSRESLERVLQAGVELLGETDYDGFTLSELSRRAQVSVGSIYARFGSKDYRPPVLPAVAMQVHNLTRRNDTAISDVVALVRRDPLLAADVLRRAQSPMFATKVAPRTLEDAASRLGMNGLRDLVFEVALGGKVFRAKGFEEPMDALRKHCLLVAYCTQAVAQMTRTPAASESTSMIAMGAQRSFALGVLPRHSNQANSRGNAATSSFANNASANHSTATQRRPSSQLYRAASESSPASSMLRAQT